MNILGSLLMFIVCIPIYLFLINQYNNVLKSKSKKVKSLLLTLRSLSILFLMFLILNPLFVWNKTYTYISDIAVFIDASKSIETQLNDTNESLENLVNQIENKCNNQNINIDWYSFGDTLKSIKNPKKVKLKEKSTNFEIISKHLQLNPIQEVIILSDGVETSGPEIHSLNFENVKVNTVGIGVPSTQVDLSINNLNYSKNILNGDSLHIDVQLESILNNQTESTVSITDNVGKTIYSNSIEFSKGISNMDVKISLPYVLLTPEVNLKITPIQNEVNIVNNEVAIELDISNDREKVLFVSGRLSPNTSWINNTLNELDFPNIQYFFKISENRWNAEINLIDFTHIKMIVLENYPSNNTDMRLLNKMLEVHKSKNIPLVYFEGPELNLNLVQNIFRQLDVEINAEKPQSAQNLDLNSFNPKYENNVYPPLMRSNYINTNNQNTNALFYEDNSVALVLNDQMLGVFIPELNKAQMQINNSSSKNILKNIIQRLLNELYFGKDNLLTLELDGDQYYVNSQVEMIVNAESIQNIENVRINVETDNVNYEIVCSEVEDGMYKGIFSPSQTGNYVLKAYCTTLEETTISSKNLEIEIQAIDLETELSYLNENTLSGLSENTMGTYVRSNELDSLLKRIIPQSVIEKEIVNFDALRIQNYWWILILLFSTEWFIRKKEGLL